MTDPLGLLLDRWDVAVVRSLIGRHESQRLELQGAIDPASGAGRRGVAEEAAGMASAVGGFIIIGANSGDVLTGLPGILASEEDAERLRNSVLDSVQPYVLMRGPRLFEADDPQKVILVLQVLPHPLGLPASVGGVFRVRVEDSCRQMPYDEVRRRFQAARDEVGPAQEQAERAMTGVRERLEVAHSYVPAFAVALVPLHGPLDLSLTGRALERVFREVAGQERDPWFRVEGLYWGPLDGPLQITATGVRSEVRHYFSWFLAHDGTFAAAVDLIGPYQGLTGQLGNLPYEYFCSAAARLVSFGAALQFHLGIAGASLVVVESGPVAGLVFEEPGGFRRTEAVLDPPQRVRYQFGLPVRAGTQETVASEVALFCQRVHDGTGQGIDVSLSGRILTYMAEMLAR